MNKNIGLVDCAFRSPQVSASEAAQTHGERREVVVNGTSEDGRYPRTLGRTKP